MISASQTQFQGQMETPNDIHNSMLKHFKNRFFMSLQNSRIKRFNNIRGNMSILILLFEVQISRLYLCSGNTIILNALDGHDLKRHLTTRG